MHSFGIKNPTQSKKDRIVKYHSAGSLDNDPEADDANRNDQNAGKTRYYPKVHGNYDEWAAMEASQKETADQLMKMMGERKRELMVNEYGKGEYLGGLAR